MNSSASSYCACEKSTKDTPSSVGPTPAVGLVSQHPLFGQDVIVHPFSAHCLHAAVPVSQLYMQTLEAKKRTMRKCQVKLLRQRMKIL